MSQHSRFDASRSLTALEQDSTIIAVIEMSQAKWLVAALVPGVERQPLKKFDAHEEMLLHLEELPRSLRLGRREKHLGFVLFDEPSAIQVACLASSCGVGSEEAPIEGLASVRQSNGTCSFPAFRFHEWFREVRREGIGGTRVTLSTREWTFCFRPSNVK
jgi:hypothetical protein